MFNFLICGVNILGTTVAVVFVLSSGGCSWEIGLVGTANIFTAFAYLGVLSLRYKVRQMEKHSRPGTTRDDPSDNKTPIFWLGIHVFGQIISICALSRLIRPHWSNGPDYASDTIHVTTYICGAILAVYALSTAAAAKTTYWDPVSLPEDKKKALQHAAGFGFLQISFIFGLIATIYCDIVLGAVLNKSWTWQPDTMRGKVWYWVTFCLWLVPLATH